MQQRTKPTSSQKVQKKSNSTYNKANSAEKSNSTQGGLTPELVVVVVLVVVTSNLPCPTVLRGRMQCDSVGLTKYTQDQKQRSTALRGRTQCDSVGATRSQLAQT